MALERIYLSANEQRNCLNAINDPAATQKDVVEMLVDCKVADLVAMKNGETRVDFKMLAEALVKRWPKGFERINDQVVRKFRELLAQVKQS